MQGLHYRLIATVLLFCASTLSASATSQSTTNAGEADLVNAAVRGWAQAWDSSDVPNYLAHYAKDFVPAGKLSREQWEQQRRSRLTTKSLRQVLLSDMQITMKAGQAEARFTQHYLDVDLIGTTRKALILVKQNGAWKIREEQVLSESMARRQIATSN